ncbi:MAG: ABC transporter substrate-binding protein [Pseudomonadota bacterium]
MARKLIGQSILAASLSVGMGAASAAATDVNFMMDWAWQGPQSFALMARNSGCFEEKGINITLDRGFGSGRVPVELAGGNYDMGVADINPTIKFRAENPDSDLIAVAVMMAGTPLVAVVKADSDIVEPEDFNGATLAAPDFDAGRQLFPIFADATGIDQSTIEWISVSPELREPMLARGEADGITGFITSSSFSLERIGVPPEEQRIFRYKDFGAELYSTSILTTQAFADENPEAVSAVVECMIRGMGMAVGDPEAAIAALVDHEPLTDADLELRRWQLSIDEMVLTDAVKEGGLSNIDPEFFQRSIESVENAYDLPNVLTVDDVYTDAFLPPLDVRMMPTM